MSKRLFTPKDLYKEFDGNVSMITIYRWLESGKVPCLKIGRRIFIPGEWVERLGKVSV